MLASRLKNRFNQRSTSREFQGESSQSTDEAIQKSDIDKKNLKRRVWSNDDFNQLHVAVVKNDINRMKVILLRSQQEVNMQDKVYFFKILGKQILAISFENQGFHFDNIGKSIFCLKS